MGRGLKKSVKPFEDKRITQLLEDYGDYLVHFRGFTEITKKGKLCSLTNLALEEW